MLVRTYNPVRYRERRPAGGRVETVAEAARVTMMDQAAPLIYSRLPVEGRVSWVGRWAALAVAAVALGVLCIALLIRPDASGLGSHRQLGLAACQFQERSGVPCPTCGMTTSFAHFVRGQVVKSAYVQPMGMVVALAVAGAFWGGLYIAITGRPAQRLLWFVPARYYLTVLFAGTILAWIWKIWIHVRGSAA